MFLDVILIIIGIVFGVAIGAWWGKERSSLRLELSRQALKQTQEYKSQIENELIEFKLKNNELIDKNAELKTDNAKSLLAMQLEEKNFKKQLLQLDKQKEILKNEFENLANKILEEKSQQFKKLNTESVFQILNPVKEEMSTFKKRMEHLYEKETEQRIELKTELINLQKLNQTITQQTSELTNALQGKKKEQGKWGELMLENILDSSGLRLNKDYKREVSLSGEDGRQRPDVVIYLPKNKHIIIDAKTSLVAYTRYVNSDNELEARQYLSEHVQAVSERIQELSERRYSKAEGLNPPEVVIMFMPIESAYVEALKIQPDLYQQAIEKQILVTTPTTLLTSLSMVRQLWQFEEQNKHTAELAKRAEKFYNKLNGFLLSMQKIGRQLDNAKDSYDMAFGQLYSGKGNLIKQASEFKKLGVSVTKELPPELTNKANLELKTHNDN